MKKYIKILVIVNLVLAFCLVTLGGVVHNTGSSLACPDWPLCFNKIMPKMVGNVAIEHSHRLLATLVGFINIIILALSLLLFKNQQAGKRLHKKILKWSFISLVWVIFQGILGGLTVLLKLSPALSSAHLFSSQIYMAMLLYILYLCKQHEVGIRKWNKDLMVCCLAILFQMVLGAYLRHSGATAACDLGELNPLKCGQNLSFFNPWHWTKFLNFSHRALGLALLIIIPLKTYKLFKQNICHTTWIYLTLLAQVILGIITIYTHVDPFIVTLHLVFAMILWMLTLWLTLKNSRAHL